MTWSYDPTMLSTNLEHAGYDVDDSQARGLGGGGSLSGRRDRAAGTVLVAIDSGGRVKVTITRSLRVPATDDATVEGLAVRILVEETRTETIAAELPDMDHVRALLDFVDRRLAAEPAPPEPDSDTPRREARPQDERKHEV